MRHLNGDLIAAFLAGVASIMGAGYSIKRARKQEREACEVRIHDIKEAHERGLAEGLHLRERDE